MTSLDHNLEANDPRAPITQGATHYAEKWPKIDRGFTSVPNVLIFHQEALGLSPAQFVVLLNLLVHRFTGERPVFPTTNTIAKRMGVSPRYVNAILKQLVEKRLIERRAKIETASGKRNSYTFNGLVRTLQSYSGWASQQLDDHENKAKLA